MRAHELAKLLNAKKVSKGKWQARCPSHPDRKPSLAIAEGKKGVVIRCMSHGCDTRDILNALGLRWADLFDGKPSPEMRVRLSLQAEKENLEHQLGLAIWLGALEKPRRRYWAAAERRIRGELDLIRCKIEPEEVYREYKARELQNLVARFGWDRLWTHVRG